MKLNKILGILFLLLLSINLTYSIDDNNLVSWYKMYDDALDSTGLNDCTNGGVDFSGGNYGSFVDTESDWIDCDNLVNDIETNTQGTISLWLNSNDVTSALNNLFSVADYQTSNSRYRLGLMSGVLNTQLNDGSWAFIVNSNSALSISTDYHIAITQDGTTLKMYINGVLQTSTGTGEWWSSLTNLDSVAIGRDDGQAIKYYYDGKMWDLSIWNSSLDQTGINELYNSGNNYTYEDLVPPTASPLIEILNINVNDETFINNTIFDVNDLYFNVTYQYNNTEYGNGTNSTQFSLIDLDNGVFNQYIEVCTNSSNLTCDARNITFTINQTGITPELIFNSIKFNGETLVNNSYINTLDITASIEIEAINTTTENLRAVFSLFKSPYTIGTELNFPTPPTSGSNISWSITDPNPNIITDGQYKIDFFASNNIVNKHSGYYYFIIDSTNPVTTHNIPSQIDSYNLTGINITATDTNLDSCIFTFESTNYTCSSFTAYNFTTSGYKDWTITTIDLAGNEVIETGTLLVNPKFYVYFNDINNVSITDFSINSTSYVNRFSENVYDYGLGTHNFIFNKFGYNESTFQLTFTDTGILNQTFIVPGAKILISIYDIADYQLITGSNTSIEIIGDSFSQIYYTTNGTLTIESLLMLEETYVVIISNPDYETSTTSFNFNNQQVLEVIGYLTPLVLNDTLIADLIVSVVDDYAGPLRNIPVYQYVWDSGQSKYVQVNLKSTDYNGETSFKVFLNTKLYNFCAEYLNVLYCETDLSININTQEIVIEIPISELSIPDTDVIYDTNFPYSLINNTYESGGINYTSVTFSYSNANQDVDQYCLKLYKIVNLQRTLVANQCDTSHTAALSINIVKNTSINYVAVATIQIGDSVRVLDELVLYKTYVIQDELDGFGFVKLLLLVIVSLIIGVALHKKVHNIAIAHLGLPVIFLLFTLFFPDYISFESFVLVLLTNLFAWSIITKKDDLNKEKQFSTLNTIIALYMIFIFGLFTALTEIDNKGMLDDYGQIILDNIADDNSYFNTFADTTIDNLKTKRADTNTGAWDLLTGIFLKTLEFVDVFFSILSNLFNIATNVALIIGIKNALLLKFLKVIDYLSVAFVVYLYFKEAFK